MNSQNNAPSGAQKPNPNRNNRAPGSNFKNNRRRYKGNHNRNKSAQANPNSQAPQNTTERMVEKYINLLDQHLIARRKYHDLFYRSEGGQKAKLEKNFFNTIIELREFENKLPPEIKESFEKRINGLRPDTTYSSNHNIDLNQVIPSELETAPILDPHYLKSQEASNFREDVEESMGTLEDYNKYKNIF